MSRHLLVVVAVTIALEGCTLFPRPHTPGPERPDIPVARLQPDKQAEAYYYYSLAQLTAQSGQYKQAIAEIRQVLI